jgi:cysteine desulfurase
VRVYLDWNATTPPLPEVLDAMRAAAERAWANPASVHGDGRAARAVVEDARAAVAALGGVDARDVVLTSGGTEANNLALRSAFAASATGRAGQARQAGEDAPRVLVTSRLEHPSVARVAEALEAEGRARVVWLPPRPDGTLDPSALVRVLEAERGQVALVTVQPVNHETGVLQPVREIASLARASGARVHVDAVQAWGRLARDADMPLFGGDTAALAGHKIRGPKGLGALLVRPGVQILPVLLGGAQEKGIRPGTVDPVAAAGLGAAALGAVASVPRWEAVRALRDALEASLFALGVTPPPQVVGACAPRAPHVLSVVWPGWSGAELVAALDLEGVSISSGAACSAGTVEASPVLRAMLGDELAGRGVRVSLGEGTTREDVDRAIAAFGRVLRRSALS